MRQGIRSSTFGPRHCPEQFDQGIFLPKPYRARSAVESSRQGLSRSGRVSHRARTFFAVFAITFAVATWAGEPVARSVSQILPRPDQTIVIDGSGFGTHAPYDGFSDFLQVVDTSKPWGAGTTFDIPPDKISVSVASWVDSRIVIRGFAGAYGQTSALTLSNGDQVVLRIWNPQTVSGPTICYANVGFKPEGRCFNESLDATNAHLNGTSIALPRLLHECDVNCNTLKLVNGNYELITRYPWDTFPEPIIWKVERFTQRSVRLHRTYPLDQVFEGEVAPQGNSLLNVTVNGSPSALQIAWGNALASVYGNNLDRDSAQRVTNPGFKPDTDPYATEMRGQRKRWESYCLQNKNPIGCGIP